MVERRVTVHPGDHVVIETVLGNVLVDMPKVKKGKRRWVVVGTIPAGPGFRPPGDRFIYLEELTSWLIAQPADEDPGPAPAN